MEPFSLGISVKITPEDIAANLSYGEIMQVIKDISAWYGDSDFDRMLLETGQSLYPREENLSDLPLPKLVNKVQQYTDELHRRFNKSH